VQFKLVDGRWRQFLMRPLGPLPGDKMSSCSLTMEALNSSKLPACWITGWTKSQCQNYWKWLCKTLKKVWKFVKSTTPPEVVYSVEGIASTNTNVKSVHFWDILSMAESQPKVPQRVNPHDHCELFNLSTDCASTLSNVVSYTYGAFPLPPTPSSI